MIPQGGFECWLNLNIVYCEACYLDYLAFVTPYEALSEVSHFQLCLEDLRRRVWRRQGQCVEPAFTMGRHIGPQPGVIQNHARPHTARVAMNCFTACQRLLWSARSPDLSPIEHFGDMGGRKQHLPEKVDDLTRQLEQI
ncbi:transposable element Tc1 transposase [Trichonephila clavipes]|nr:transposable element Tc1 transposase [Trichonephila clavipes]